MRLKLDVDLCKKLLTVFVKHDRTSCTDQNKNNQYSNSEGWVSCTRCWLLQAVEDNCIPEETEFELYSSIKIQKKDAVTLLREYIELVNELGIEHLSCCHYLEQHKGNREFINLANLAKSLRKKTDEERNK